MSFGTFMLIVMVSAYLAFSVTGLNHVFFGRREVKKAVGRKVSWYNWKPEDSMLTKIQWFLIMWLIEILIGFFIVGFVSAVVLGEKFKKEYTISLVKMVVERNDFTPEEIERLNHLVESHNKL